jgi:hypothetical protein
MNEKKNPLDFIVRAVNYMIDVIARVLVDLFDGVKNAIDHANPSLFSLVATLLPFALPLPVAFMTAHSAKVFFGWDAWAANVLGFGLEGLGLLAWVKLVDSVLDYIKTNNGKITAVIWMYGGVALVYEVLLIFVNAVFAWQEGANWDYVIVLVCVCLLPALSAMTYGHQRRTVEGQLAQERREQAEQAEKIRQERRQDRKEAAAMRVQYAAEMEGGGLKLEKKFRGKK